MSHSPQGQLIRFVRKPQLAQEIDAFVIDRRARGLSERTIEYYDDELHNLQVHLQAQGITTIVEITAAELRHFLLELGERRNAGGVHASYRAIRAFLNWYNEEYEPENWKSPIRKVHPPKVPQQQLPAVPLADVKKMIATCERYAFTGDRDKAILLCLLDTGCRANEFTHLDLGDVNLKSGVVIVRKGKGGKFRTAFLGTKTRRELLRYLRHREETGPSAPLWVTVHGKRLSYKALRSIVRRRADTAGVQEPSLHSFRRAFALSCLRGGMDVYSLQKLMGHSDLSILRRYLAQTDADLKLAHEKAAPVDNLL